MLNQVLSEKIYQTAITCGYDGCGIIPIEAMTGYKKRIEERMEKIPESKKVYRFYDAFTRLRELHPWAKSVVICTIWLGKYTYPKSLQGKYAKAFMLSPDTVPESPVHQKKLQFETWLQEQHIHFEGGEKNVPTRIMPLRHAAVAAGLGIFRKNNFFYGEKGSYYMLEGYLIDQECEYIHTPTIKPCAEQCTLCRQACPTKSLSEPYTMNPLTCVSFLTTFGGGMIPAALDEKDLGSWICGCDACQDACPYNRRHDWSRGEAFYGLKDIEDLLKPQHIVTASDEELCTTVIPKTDFHIPPEKVTILRICAARAIRNEGIKK